MKRILLFSALSIFLFNSCSVGYDSYEDDPTVSLYDYLQTYDIWYVDINKTSGTGEIPFLQRAFTLTFANRTLRANNNLVGIGNNGNGYGIVIGSYYTSGKYLAVDHAREGSYRFEVVQVSANEIDLYDLTSNLVYRLVGYNSNNFDYDMLFYDNIRYFLQEYEVWEKTYTSQQGTVNAFDDENFLRFISGQGDRYFDSSKDAVGIPLNQIVWDYSGEYAVSNIQGTNDVKLLTLNYGADVEQFELRVLNDAKIELYHTTSATIYQFGGINNIIYLKSTNDAEKETRKRFKDILPTVKYEIQKK